MQDLKCASNLFLNIFFFQVYLYLFAFLFSTIHKIIYIRSEYTKKLLKNNYLIIDNYINNQLLDLLKKDIENFFKKEGIVRFRKDGGSNLNQILYSKCKSYLSSESNLLLEKISDDIINKIYGKKLKNIALNEIFFEKISNNGFEYDSQNDFHVDTYYERYQVFISLDKQLNNIDFEAIPSSANFSFFRIFFKYINSIIYSIKDIPASWRLKNSPFLKEYYNKKRKIIYDFIPGSLFICNGSAFHRRVIKKNNLDSSRFAIRAGVAVHPLFHFI